MSTFKPYLEQNFEVLKSNCLKSGKLFEDDKFPANDTSLYRFQKFVTGKISWKRPHEITQNPQFIVDFIEPNDLDQGQIGNCWMVAAAACVLSVPEYLKRVIPDGQTFDKNNYAGIFHFRFWINGEWVDVVVDDRIPVNENNHPIFCHNSVDKNEIFGPLLEKAYAKLNVCYEFLIGGNSKDALLDFTGGVNETYDLTRCLPTAKKDRFIEPNTLWELMFKAAGIKSLFSCAADVRPNQRMEQRTNNGLVVGHAYSIIQLFEILNVGGQFSEFRLSTGKKPDPSVKTIRLLKIRNPWGQKESYRGRWGKSASEWKQIAPKLEQVLQPNKTDDGEFYMSFDDFYTFFTSMDTVHVDLDGLANDQGTNQTDLNWDLTQINGEWISGKNAGGCGNDPKTFWTNPQHTFDLPSKKEKCALIVSLLQTDTAQKRINSNGASQGIYEAIGFFVYSIKADSKPDSSGKYDKSVLTQVSRINTFMYQKEISKRCELPPGKYVIMPCCFEKNKNAKYLLRLYIEGNGTVSDQNKNTQVKPNDTKDFVGPIVPINPNPAVNPVKPNPTPTPNPNPNPEVNPVKPNPTPTPNPNPNPAVNPVKPNLTPTPNPNPNPSVKPDQIVDPKPSPNHIPQQPNRGEVYDKWYFNGMNQKDIENLKNQAKQTTTNACLIM
ncbi:unnamed protein product [Brachionus calyciflorus]|uniref:Calpain catalytic domain-containing protein n=1 Tax=Brachionus calyciflorus TaxID=104777 RepID=A0A814GC22_9BILA|nr:unnamed protein product [Brachionus calyciflorus]